MWRGRMSGYFLLLIPYYQISYIINLKDLIKSYDSRLVVPDPMERLVVPENSERSIPTSFSPERLLVPGTTMMMSGGPATPESRATLSPGTPEYRAHRANLSPGTSESIEVARRSPSLASAKL